jgi:hypothetical protein
VSIGNVWRLNCLMIVMSTLRVMNGDHVGSLGSVSLLKIAPFECVRQIPRSHPGG